MTSRPLALAVVLLAATPALPCLNETTMAHDEVLRIVKRAQEALEHGDYALAAKRAASAIQPLERRVAVGDGEAYGRAPVPRHKDQLALGRARAIALAAVVRSNATVDSRGKPVVDDDARMTLLLEAYQGTVLLRERLPKLGMVVELQAEVMARSTNLRREGKAALLDLQRRDLLAAPEALAALATILEEDGDVAGARVARDRCAARAAVPTQCAPVKTFGAPRTAQR